MPLAGVAKAAIRLLCLPCAMCAHCCDVELMQGEGCWVVLVLAESVDRKLASLASLIASKHFGSITYMCTGSVEVKDARFS